MAKFSASEARKKFGVLLERVKAGEEIVITRHGEAIARFVPNVEPVDKSLAFAALMRIRERARESGQRFDWEVLKMDRYPDLDGSGSEQD